MHDEDEGQKKEENYEIQVGVNFRNKIIEMLEEIDDPVILMKIYTVVRTHLKILREKEQG